MSSVRTHVPMVAGLAYRQALAQTPTEFHATLKPEPANPYNPRALAVYGPAGKVGYVSPEIARHCYEAVAAAGQMPCAGRKAPGASRTMGVEAWLDLSAVLPANV